MPRLLPFLAMAALLVGCTRDAEEHRPTAAAARDSQSASAADLGAAVVFDPEGSAARVEVELARTEQEISRGLMYRKELKPDQGMLFLFPDGDKPRSFWMKNTYVPLDMIFVSSKKVVVGVVANTEPLTTTSRRVDGVSQFVVEVNAGWAAKNGVGAGTIVRFESVDGF